MRLRLRFSSAGVSLSCGVGRLILPRILGPSSRSTLILSIVGASSFASSSAAGAASSCGAVATGSASGSAFFFLAGFTSSAAGVSAASSSLLFFFAPFLGRVEESIALRSILSITFGASISGASILESSGWPLFSATTGSSFFSSRFFSSGFFSSTGGAATGFISSLKGSGAFSILISYFFGSFLNKTASSSFLFLPSTLPFGNSIASLFSFATLSL